MVEMEVTQEEMMTRLLWVPMKIPTTDIPNLKAIQTLASWPGSSLHEH